jgi:glycosyltransferase involved in cell wall biosynthesis
LRPVNVLHLRDTYEIGGPGKTILETFRAIDASRFRLHLAVFLARADREETPFVRAARAAGMPVHFVRALNQYDPRMIGQVARMIERLNIDVVHAHEVVSDVITYLVSLRRRVPIVTTVHGWIGNAWKQRAMNRLDRAVLRRFDAVIAVSGRIRDELVESGVAPARVRLLHNGIVLDRYRRTGSRGYLAELLGRSVPTPVVSTIGRLSPEKGHADLVEALGIAAARGCRVSAVIAGDGPDRGRLADRVRELGLDGSVHFPGYVANPERLLEETDLMVLPSHTEGLPNAALEAMAMEVPVLATRVGGTPEVIADGQTGRLVAPRSPEALAAGIMDFVASPGAWRAFAARGRDVVETQFDFGTRTRKLEALYGELAGVACA